jgi:hypothetical protein
LDIQTPDNTGLFLPDEGCGDSRENHPVNVTIPQSDCLSTGVVPPLLLAKLRVGL